MNIGSYYLVNIRKIDSNYEGYMIIRIDGITNCGGYRYTVIKSQEGYYHESTGHTSSFEKTSLFHKSCSEIDYPTNDENILAYLL